MEVIGSQTVTGRSNVHGAANGSIWQMHALALRDWMFTREAQDAMQK